MLSVTKRQLGLIVRTYQTAMTALTLLGIALVSCVLHKEWIVFMTLLAFLGARQLTEEPYHCNSLVTCLAVSILVFTCILRLVPSLSWSLAAGPLIAVAIAYSSSYIPKFKKYKQYYESQTSFDIDNPTELEMRTRCEARKFTPAETEICIQLFCKQGTVSSPLKSICLLLGPPTNGQHAILSPHTRND